MVPLEGELFLMSKVPLYLKAKQQQPLLQHLLQVASYLSPPEAYLGSPIS